MEVGEGVGDSIFPLHNYFSWVEKTLHTEFQLPRLPRCDGDLVMLSGFCLSRCCFVLGCGNVALTQCLLFLLIKTIFSDFGQHIYYQI